MKIYSLNRSKFELFVDRLFSYGELWAPTKKKDKYVYKQVEDKTEIHLDYHRTLLPIKKLFFPKKQQLLSFSFDSNKQFGEAVTAIATPSSNPKIIFGIHPCEINALNIQDEFFMDGKYQDPYYGTLRKDTIIIGHSCLPDQHCVCNNTGTSDVTKGFDLFFNELPNKYLVWVGSSIGDQLILENDDLFEDKVSKEDLTQFNDWNRKRNKMFTHDFDGTIMPKLMELSYENEFWDEIGSECLSCGTCTAVCPTCSCYNVIDRLELGNGSGSRDREWDSCQFPEFSAVAGGGDFRPNQGSRLKLYYTHKLDSYKGEINYPSCVGCGRCVEFCPVDINVIRITNQLTEMKL